MKVWFISDYYTNMVYAICNNTKDTLNIATEIIHKFPYKKDVMNSEISRLYINYQKNPDDFRCDKLHIYSTYINDYTLLFHKFFR